MIDFTDLQRRNKTYAGANGNKIAIMYQGEQYMLKFPGQARRNKEMSYANGCISEYLGSHIFQMVGIPAQETLLGTFTKHGRERIVVACKDFTVDGSVLQDFASLKNTVIDSEQNGYGTELDDIMQAMDEQQIFEPSLLRRHFWDMFIVDALIGNWDRHNGNWGFLYYPATDMVKLAPVYDCGSCLYPQANESIMQSVLEDQAERNLRVFEIPLSDIRQNNQKIAYFAFISSLQNRECNAALKRIVGRINMDAIQKLVDETPYITDLQKQFYKTMLKERKEKILDFSLNKLLKMERAQPCEQWQRKTWQ